MADTGTPYATAPELGAYLRQDIQAETESFDHATLAVTAASDWVTKWCRREFNLATTASARYFDAMRDGTLLVDDIGDATFTVASDAAQDGTHTTVWAAGDYQVSPLMALAAGEPITSLLAVGANTFPWVSRRRGLVKVTAKWGWPTVPEPIKLATLIQAARLLKRRDSAEGVLGGNEFGVVRVPNRIDYDIESLLAPFRYLSAA